MLLLFILFLGLNTCETFNDFSKTVEKEQWLVGQMPDLVNCLRAPEECCEGDKRGADQ